ncbi:MAG: SPOR domain-containing protein [Ignavibacteria bacterium]|nr:SPOR domain-containing protein [Ignavibacteria bacterium]
MPKLNLKDEGAEDETRPIGDDFSSTAPPTLRDIGGSGGGPSPLLQVLIAIIVLGAGTFALNYFGVIHLWGKKPATRVIQTPPAEQFEPPVAETPVEQTPTPTPTPSTAEVTPTPTPGPSKPATTVTRQPVAVGPMGTGAYTVQVSAWLSRSKADEEVARLEQAGLPAFVESKPIGGETWYRVRVGKYPTSGEARVERDKLQKMLAGNIWVGRVSAN